jgi:hypothetical protein
MELFGYVCSPLCRAKAVARGLNIPVYPLQKSVVEARRWRLIALIGWGIGAGILALAGIWFWYAWFGSVPKLAYSLALPEMARSGVVRLVDRDQLVFLHGGKLRRVDMGRNLVVWAVTVVDKAEFATRADAALKAMVKEQERRMETDEDAEAAKLPSRDALMEAMAAETMARLKLQVDSRNLWIISGATRTQYDWGTGRTLQTSAIEGREGDNPPPLDSGDNPELNYAERLTLPALVAGSRHQQQVNAQLPGTTAPKAGRAEPNRAQPEPGGTRVVAAADGSVQFTVTLVERKLVAREAMKPTPKKFALEEGVSAGNSMTVAGEMLNEMQRERGSTVTEDLSRYRVSVRRANAGSVAWTGEVTGPPTFHALRTVDLITAGASVIALDHENNMLWQADLNFPVTGVSSAGTTNTSRGQSGFGPCVEQGNTIFVYDAGSLAAFDRGTGKAHWRLPSVGIRGLWFDEKGMVYIDTTTAGLDSVRYSKQINLSEPAAAQILKVDPATGKTLWRQTGAGHIRALWKREIYTVENRLGGNEGGSDLLPRGEDEQPGFVHIRQIDTGSGKVTWEHAQRRGALDVQCRENSIQLLFPKEVQHLKFLVW